MGLETERKEKRKRRKNKKKETLGEGRVPGPPNLARYLQWIWQLPGAQTSRTVSKLRKPSSLPMARDIPRLYMADAHNAKVSRTRAQSEKAR